MVFNGVGASQEAIRVKNKEKYDTWCPAKLFRGVDFFFPRAERDIVAVWSLG
jgi:hypothetical protein